MKHIGSLIEHAIEQQAVKVRVKVESGSILNDGAISACPNISKKLTQSNILTNDFKTIWEKGFAQFRNRSWMKTEPWEQCKYWSQCQGNSLQLWDDNTGHTCLCHNTAYAPAPIFRGQQQTQAPSPTIWIAGESVS